MMTYLADFMISGEWLVGAAVALIPVLGAVWIKAKKAGLKEATNNVTIQSPVPTLDVTTREHPEFVTHGQLNGHLTRIEDSFDEIKDALNNERGIARTANGNIHARLDKVMENQATARGELTQINLNVQRLLDRTDNKPPRPRG